MLEVWKAKIKAEIPGHVWPYCDLDVRKHFFGDNSKKALTSDSITRLAKYYYFSKYSPKNPIIARQLESDNLGIHPGVCRFIGSFLKNEEIWLDSIIYIDRPRILNPNVIWLEKLEEIENKTSHDAAWEHFDESDWNYHDDYRSLLINDSQNARIEIISEFNKKIVFNPRGEWIISENIKDHNGMIPTLKEVFKKIEQVRRPINT